MQEQSHAIMETYLNVHEFLFVLIISFSEAPEIVSALLTHTAVKQITERDLSAYKTDESEDACKLLNTLMCFYPFYMQLFLV